MKLILLNFRCQRQQTYYEFLIFVINSKHEYEFILEIENLKGKSIIYTYNGIQLES